MQPFFISVLQGTVAEAVMDRMYMGQLVAVQHRRGARNGHAFASALGLGLGSYDMERTETERREEKERRTARVVGAVPTIPPRATALIPPSQVKTTLMHLFDVGSPSRMTMKEKRDAFRTLQKFLVSADSTSAPMLEATVKALDQIMRTEHRANFATSMSRHPSFSCALVRLLSSALSRPGATGSSISILMGKVSTALLEQLQTKEDKPRSSLISLLEAFQLIVAVKGAPRAPSSPSPTKASRKKGDRKRKKEEELQHRDEVARRNLEGEIHAKVDEALRKRNTKPLVSEMASLLLSEEEGRMPAIASKAGLFVDWLEMLDPELFQLDEEVQQQLLFSKRLVRVAAGSPKKKKVSGASARPQSSSSSSAQSSRPYVLTMLTHQSSWRSLRAVVGRVLESHNEDFEAAAVLDFLAACAYIPKLWHGMDKHQPKHAAPADVLDLTEDQIKVLVDYHLAEAEEKGVVDQETEKVFRPRMALLLRCLSARQKANAAVEHLFWKIVSQGTGSGRDVARQLLLHVYMGRPSCLVHLQTGGLDDMRRASLLPSRIGADTAASTCALDVATHTLLSALAETRHGRAWATQMLEFEAAAR